MSTPYYRLTVVVCALTWFLVGLHAAPMLHEFKEHGRIPGAGLLVIIGLLVVIASGSVWALLRASRPHSDSRPAAS